MMVLDGTFQKTYDQGSLGNVELTQFTLITG